MSHLEPIRGHVMQASFAILVVLTAFASYWTASSPDLPADAREFGTALIVGDADDAASNISIGDVDADGDLDLLLVSGRHLAGSLRLLLNDGRGRFTASEVAKTPDNSYAAPFIDIDGDRDLDIVVGTDEATARFVFVNDGKGHFRDGGRWNTMVSDGWRNIAISDVNRDHHPDIIVAARGSVGNAGASAICLNTGSGQFGACRAITAGSTTTIVPVDLDKDGDTDLVAPHRDLGFGVVLLNDGQGEFSTAKPFGSSGAEVRAAATGDLNADGWPDIVAGDMRMGVEVYLNDGRGHLERSGTLAMPRNATAEALEDVPYAIAVADLNRDGKPDVVLGNSGQEGRILFNEGSGRSFAEVAFGDAAGSTYGLAVGDLDGDGYPDVAAARSGAPSTVYFSRPGSARMAIRVTDRPEPKVSLPGPIARDPKEPTIGVWHGALIQGAGGLFRQVMLRGKESYEISLSIQRNEAGTISARTIYYSDKTIVRCSSENTLEKVLEHGVYLFRETPPLCGDEPSLFAVQLLGEDRLGLRYYLANESQPPAVTVELRRKVGRTP